MKIIIYVTFILLVSCSNEKPIGPIEQTFIGSWDLSQHIWSNKVVSDSPCVDLAFHLDLSTIGGWTKFNLQLTNTHHSSSYTISREHYSNGFGITWELPNPDTLYFYDSRTLPKFKFSLEYDEKFEFLNLRDNSGKWIFIRN